MTVPGLLRRHRVEGRRWSLSRIFAVGAAVAALVAVATAGLGGVALVRLDAARTSLFDVVGPINLAVHDLSTALVNQESGVRGFVLTGRAESREPYDGGLADQRTAMATVGTLAAQNGLGAVTADLAALETTVDRWRAVYAEPALAGTAPAGSGKAQFDAVRAALHTLQADVDAQRITARDRFDGAVAFLTGAGTAIAVLIAVFLAAAAVGLRRTVLGPVSDLAVQVRGVVAGDVHRPVGGEGPREIVELGDDVDAMRLHILGDLEAEQEANRRLDEQTRELERSNRDLEQFAYVASHDLQEPLRKVSSFCQLLQRRYGGQLDERADQYIGFAVDGAARMQQLINDLLAFSRVGRSTEGFRPVALDETVAAAIAELETASEVDGRVDAGALPVVTGDPALLRQLFANLVGNALKFRREGVPPVVTIGAARSGEEWEITVADNGIGIDPAYAEKVFAIFQRLHPRDLYAGTGIGLALAKKIVEFHGGRIGLDPPGDEPGTTFRFTLPAPPEAP